MKVLIVGGDSRLSKFIEKNFVNSNTQYIKTSRKNTSNSIHLDFNFINEFKIPTNLSHAIIVGGVTSYDDCENNYEYACKINCKNIPQLVSQLLKNDIFVLYISTNTVFKYNSLPKENDKPSPGFSYANLKYISEQKITSIASDISRTNKLSILRLTKNVCNNTSPFNNWLNCINEKKKFNAFNDLYFAPITFENSSKAILSIINNNYSGIFHLSGEKDLSYSDFANGFLDFLNLDKNLCKNLKSTEIGVKLLYNHPITALDMSYTEKKLNIQKIKLSEIYTYLSQFIDK